MSSRVTPLVNELRARLSKTYQHRLKGVYLFGSYARGEEDSESDVDVFIVLDRVDSYRSEIERTGNVVSQLSLESGLSISRVFVSEADWQAGKSLFLAHAREEAVPV